MLELTVYGIVLGSIISLGAIGLSLVYGILRFANFAHGDLMTTGAYVALFLVTGPFAWMGVSDKTFGPFSFGWKMVIAFPVSMLAVAGVAWSLLVVLSHWNLKDQNVPGHLAEKHYQVAGVAELQGRLDLARRHYEQAIARDPCHVQSRLNLSVLLSRAGETAAAQGCLREAIRCDPTYPKPYFNLAIIESERGRAAVALELLDQATRWRRTRSPLAPTPIRPTASRSTS